MLRQLVITDFKLRYQSSFLGYLWSLIKPMALFAILYVVFSVFLRIGESVPHFPVYLLLGIVLWNYFAEVTVSSVQSIVTRGDLIRKINFPKYVIVLAGSFSAFINLCINFLVVFGFMYFTGVDFRWDGFLVPILVLQLFVLSLAISFFLSAAYVRFRDINYIWEVIMQGAFYATPILYPLSLVPDMAAKALMLSPMAQIIQDIRYLMITEQTETIDQVFGNQWIRLVPLGITLLVALLAAQYFRSQSKFFAENV